MGIRVCFVFFLIYLTDKLRKKLGDGGFSIYVRSAKDYALLEKVYCRFHIAQHIKDQELLKLFIKFF